MGSSSDHIGMREGAGMLTGTDKSCNVCDIGKEDRTYFISDLSKFGKVDLSGIRRSTTDDDLGLDGLGDLHHFIIVDATI